jgi:hypothetical protein
MAAAGVRAYEIAAETSMTTEQMILKIWENVGTYLNGAVEEYKERKSSCFDKIAVVMKVLSEFVVGSRAFSEELEDPSEGYDLRLIYSYMIRRLDRLVDFDDPGDEEFFEITREIAGFAATIREAFAKGMARPGYIPVSQMGGDIRRFAGRLGNVA